MIQFIFISAAVRSRYENRMMGQTLMMTVSAVRANPHRWCFSFFSTYGGRRGGVLILIFWIAAVVFYPSKQIPLCTTHSTAHSLEFGAKYITTLQLVGQNKELGAALDLQGSNSLL